MDGYSFNASLARTEVRAPHLSFMMLKEYWFRELYLGLKVTASFDRSESYTRVFEGKMHHAQSQAAEFAGHLEHSFRAGMDDPTRIPQPTQRKHKNRKFRQSHPIP